MNVLKPSFAMISIVGPAFYSKISSEMLLDIVMNAQNVNSRLENLQPIVVISRNVRDRSLFSRQFTRGHQHGRQVGFEVFSPHTALNHKW